MTIAAVQLWRCREQRADVQVSGVTQHRVTPPAAASRCRRRRTLHPRATHPPHPPIQSAQDVFFQVKENNWALHYRRRGWQVTYDL